MKKFGGTLFMLFLVFFVFVPLSSAEFRGSDALYQPRFLMVYKAWTVRGDDCPAAVESPEALQGSFDGFRPGLTAATDSSDTKGVTVPRDGEGESIVLCQVAPGEGAQNENNDIEIADPLEPINRAFYHFNDKLYFWVLKPAATGYKTVTPKIVRVGVKNFFHNLAFPIRFVNCLLQGKANGAGDEFVRFLTNSTIGLGGLIDVAGHKLKLKKHNEDLGQTLGSYGMGPAFYINWPFLGPSSLRDTLGKIGDYFLDPLNYMVPRTKYRACVAAYSTVNKTSLVIGEYEDLKKAAIDPYLAIRNAYYQNRKSQIEE